MNRKKIGAVLLSGMLLLSGCAQKESNEQIYGDACKEMTTFAMDTVMQFIVCHEDGEAIMTEAEQEIRSLEKQISMTMRGSDISKLNANAGKQSVSVSEDTWNLLHRGKEMGEITEQAFDLTISPIVQAWGFTTDHEKKVPSQEVLEQLLPLTDERDLILDEEKQSAFLQKKGMAVDLGGIAKGYTSDAVIALMRERGVTGAVISLGGNVATIGHKPDGSPWRVGIQNPLNTEDYVGLLELVDASAITSGGYNRFFVEDGKKYHHIINSETGYPAESGLLSVTIVSVDGAKADALSTALFVMGMEKGLELWRNSDDFEVIFITEDGRVIATEGAAERFTFEGRDNDFTYETVER